LDATLQTLYVAHSRLINDGAYDSPITAVQAVAEELFGKTEKAEKAAYEAGSFIISNHGKLNGDTLDLFYRSRAKRTNAW
jgi:hypothetical protein